MNLKKLAAICATVLSVPFSQAATTGYVAETAPDAVSRQILKHPLRAFEEGATGTDDIAAAIERNFPKLIEQSLASMRSSTAAAWIDQLSDLELEHMAQLYVNSNAVAGRPGKFLLVAAARLDGSHLVRLSRFFGYGEVYSAIIAIAPQNVNAFLSQTSVAYPAPLPGGVLRVPVGIATMSPDGGVSAMGSFTPSTAMTLRQLYLGFRSMQIGSMAVSAAIYETSMYAGKHLVLAWGAGYYFGSEISSMMQEYTPDFYHNTFVPAVGGTIARATDFVQNTVLTTYNNRSNASSLGVYQASTLPVYGNSLSVQGSMAATGGDYQMEYEYQQAYGSGGGGGCRTGRCPPIYAY